MPERPPLEINMGPGADLMGLLDENRPYEVYCSDCLAAHFPKAKMVK